MVKGKLGFILSMEGCLGRMACWEVRVLIKMKNKYYREKRQLGKGPCSPTKHTLEGELLGSTW